MNGIYSNIKPYSKPFIFRKGVLNKSCRLNCYTFSKVGNFKPLEYGGNVMLTTNCLVDWTDED